MNISNKMKITLLILFILCLSYTKSDINVFIGSESNLWSNTNNWSLKRLPTKNDTIIINTTDALLENFNAQINNIIISHYSLIINDSNLIILNNATNDGNIKLHGNLVLNSSNYQNIGNIQLYDSMIIGDITINAGNILNIFGRSSILGNINNYGTLQINPNSILVAHKYYQYPQSFIIIFGNTSLLDVNQASFTKCFLQLKFYKRIGPETCVLNENFNAYESFVTSKVLLNVDFVDKFISNQYYINFFGRINNSLVLNITDELYYPCVKSTSFPLWLIIIFAILGGALVIWVLGSIIYNCCCSPENDKNILLAKKIIVFK